MISTLAMEQRHEEGPRDKELLDLHFEELHVLARYRRGEGHSQKEHLEQRQEGRSELGVRGITMV